MRQLVLWSLFSSSLAHASLPNAMSAHTRWLDYETFNIDWKVEDALEIYPLFQVNLFCRKAVQRLLSKSSVRSLTFFTVLTCFSGSACSIKGILWMQWILWSFTQDVVYTSIHLVTFYVCQNNNYVQYLKDNYRISWPVNTVWPYAIYSKRFTYRQSSPGTYSEDLWSCCRDSAHKTVVITKERKWS